MTTLDQPPHSTAMPTSTTSRCFGFRIWSRGPDAAIAALLAAAAEARAGFACFANAHMIGEAHRTPALFRALRAATWVFPDGRPVAAMARWTGSPQAAQVAGPETMEQLLDAAAQKGLPIYLFGGSPAVLDLLRRDLPARFPGLVMAGAHSPPFRPWSDTEERSDAERIRASGARLCFVALGCPKQECWMHRNAAATGSLCLGVGAAFPMLAGLTPRAPTWVRRCALEWIYRWCQEPRRLAQRYTMGNLRFACAVWRQVRRAQRRRP